MLVHVKEGTLACAVLALFVCLGAGCGDDGGGPDAGDARGDGGGEAADASGSGALCGGFSGAGCDEGLYCDYDDNRCGGQDGEGTCREAPAGCGGVYEPACGCDGEVYSNSCEAKAAGVDISDDGGCEPPDGMFPCGHGFCQSDRQYCQVALSDVVGIPDSYECVDLPEACGDAPSCDCLSDEPCGDDCAESGGDYTLTCPGG